VGPSAMIDDIGQVRMQSQGQISCRRSLYLCQNAVPQSTLVGSLGKVWWPAAAKSGPVYLAIAGKREAGTSAPSLDNG
jgi:hypothetical protein